MNWNSKSISEVAKEKIWKEHVQNEASKRVIFDHYRVNPFFLSKNSVCEPVSKRSKRFLDRDAAFLETISKRTQVHEPAPLTDSPPRLDASSGSDTLKLPNIASAAHPYEDDVHEAMHKMSLPPTRKYGHPMTESQELGWATAPLSPRDTHFNYNLRSCEITRFANVLNLSKKMSAGSK